MKIKLGKEYRDTVTGFKGIATGIFSWITGCDTVSLQPPVDKEGKVPGREVFDDNRLELVKKSKPKVIKSNKKKGGPQDNPQMHGHK